MLNNLKKYSALCLFGVVGILNAYAADDMDGINGAPIVHKWNKPGIPHRGWVHLQVEDLEDTTGECEMCDKQYIRYLHTVSHDDYDDHLRVGRDCAEKMCEDYANPKERENEVKNTARRARRAIEREEAAREELRMNWLNLANWRMTPKGGYSRKLGNKWINLFKQGVIWKYVFDNNFSPPFASVREAMLASYNEYLNR